ncbi:MAG: GTP-binding protein, partial [Phycisphaerales bacterium]|nr:GTP-binding protein [Phycisphaerales bacterium]
PICDRENVAENTLQLGRIIDDRTGDALDKPLVCRTASGVEINIHGGPHIARRVLELLAAHGAQLCNIDAEPRGPLNATHEKWNNPSIGTELLIAIPNARSGMTVAAISSQWSSGLSELVAGPLPSAEQLRSAADGLEDIEKLLNPIEVVLAGPPNAGKSTLTNALVGRGVSIVHQMAGTTRDWVREAAIVNGIPIWLTDTAGLWDAPKGIDSEAVRRARHCAAEADILILMDPDGSSLDPEWLGREQTHPTTLSVRSKCDQPGEPKTDGPIEISAMNGLGIDNLKSAIVKAANLDQFDPKTPRAFTPRQADLLTRAADAVDADDPPAAEVLLGALLRGPINRATC